MQQVVGTEDKIRKFNCDNARGLIAGARHCMWRIVTATAGMLQTNGVAERAVRAVKEGGRCGIVKSGFFALPNLVAYRLIALLFLEGHRRLRLRLAIQQDPW